LHNFIIRIFFLKLFDGKDSKIIDMYSTFTLNVYTSVSFAKPGGGGGGWGKPQIKNKEIEGRILERYHQGRFTIFVSFPRSLPISYLVAGVMTGSVHNGKGKNKSPSPLDS
jgi:hypothetical protein